MARGKDQAHLLATIHAGSGATKGLMGPQPHFDKDKSCVFLTYQVDFTTAYPKVPRQDLESLALKKDRRYLLCRLTPGGRKLA